MGRSTGAAPVARRANMAVETFGVANVARSSFHIAVGATRFARSVENHASNAKNESNIKKKFG